MLKIVECVPNFSEGRHQKIIKAIFAPVKKFPQVKLLAIESDPDHNRCLGTLIGEPKEVLAAVFEMIKVATKLINMEKHEGEHPRIGATDVVPFVPVAHVSMKECIGLAKSLAKKVSQELNIPVYLYEEAATRPDRVNLAEIRKGEYEGLKKEISQNHVRKPDFGPAKMHPTAGAMVIGARKFLIAFNINLGTKEVQVAKDLARMVREKDGGFPAVKALGFAILDKGYVQVSMNLCDFTKTNMDQVFQKIEEEAGKRNVKVLGSEIYGMVPQAALKDLDLAKLKLIDFKKEQILENRLE